METRSHSPWWLLDPTYQGHEIQNSYVLYVLQDRADTEILKNNACMDDRPVAATLHKLNQYTQHVKAIVRACKLPR